MIEEAIRSVSQKQDLTFQQSRDVIDEIMSGQSEPSQIAGLLMALAMKGETVAEISGSAQAMRSHALPFHSEKKLLEIVGTGGDQSNSFNISTTSAFVVAAAGIPVAKHGNRAASSKSGAADVLEALGAKIDISAEASEKILDQINFCFLFAQKYYTAMRYVAPVRKSLGIRTIFNILGPLANPAAAKMQLLGVYDSSLIEPMAKALQRLGVTNAMVVHGRDGLDEVSMTGETEVCELQHDQFKRYVIRPQDFGLTVCQKEDLLGASPAENAAITRDILQGKAGPKRDAVLLNAACAIHVARPELSLQAAIAKTAETIDSGAAQAELDAYVRLTQETDQ